MYRLTLDTNNYVSGLEYTGKPAALLQMARDGEVEIAISQPIIDETLRVLRDKFKWSNRELQEGLAIINACTHRVTPTQIVDVIKEDPSDNRILECAAEDKSEYIVSGDKDLLRQGTFGTARILKIAEFLDIAKTCER